MRIAIISERNQGDRNGQLIRSTLSRNDEVIELERISQGLQIDRVNIESLDLLIINVPEVLAEDLQIIASLTAINAWPAVIYICDQVSSEELLHLMRSGVSDVINDLGNEATLRQATDRIRERNNAIKLGSKGNALAFISSKGGAGATFLACNIAYSLAVEFNCRTLLVDMHIQGGDATFYLANNRSETSFADIAKHPDLDAMMLVSGSLEVENNFFVLQASDDPEKSSGLLASHVDKLIAIAVKEFDFVIIDLPQTIDGIGIKVLDRVESIFIVTQPIMTYLYGLVSMLSFFNRLDIKSEKTHVILNRMTDSRDLSLDKVEGVIQRKIHTLIPDEIESALESTNLGLPISKVSPQGPISRAIHGVATEICGGELVLNIKEPWFKRLFKK